MTDMLLNGRPAEDWEAAAIAHGRRCELERDTEQLAGVLTGDVAPERVARPVTDIVWEFS